MMKRFLITLAVCIGLVLISTPSMATHTSTSVNDFAGGLAATRHNLSSSGSHFSAATGGTNPALSSNTTSQICVFCHTPHHANNSDGAPIWNRSGQTSAGSYTNYGANAGYGGSTYTGDQTVGNPTWASLACLTCHDGVTTFDALVNRPGKGKGTSPIGWDFYEGASDESNFITSGRLVIGTDLTDDHPISKVYNELSNSLRPMSTKISGINMCNWQESDGSCSAPLVKPSNYSQLWAVSGYINAGATIGDLLRGTQNQIECSSCHDPHYKNQTNPEAYYVSTRSDSTAHGNGGLGDDGLFLRRVGGNSDSGVCRTCHAKADKLW